MSPILSNYVQYPRGLFESSTDSRNYHSVVYSFSQKRERRVNDSPLLRCNCNFSQTYSHIPAARPAVQILVQLTFAWQGRKPTCERNCCRKVQVVRPSSFLFCIFLGSLQTSVIPRTKTCQVSISLYINSALCTVRGNTQPLYPLISSSVFSRTTTEVKRQRLFSVIIRSVQVDMFSKKV